MKKWRWKLLVYENGGDFGCPHSLYQVAVSAAAIASILSSF